MPETPPANGTPADPNATPPAGDGEPQAGESDGTGEPTTISLDAARSLRSENQNLRTRLRTLEEAETQRKQAEQTELQRATERAEQAERNLATEQAARRTAELRSETATIARRLGFRDPDIAYRLIGDVEFGDDGRAKGLDKTIADLAKQHPYLVNGTADFGGGPRGAPATGGSDINAAIRERVRG